MSNNSNNNSMDEEQRRREQEINFFAAMAMSSSTPDKSTTTANPPSPATAGLPRVASATELHHPDEGDHFHVMTTPKQGIKSGTFVATSNDSNPSGTFAFATSPDNDDDRRANLQAAAAAFEETNNYGSNNSSSNLLLPNFTTPATATPDEPPFRVRQQVPMFSECIQLCRPLFFGALLPPTLLEEARHMIRDAIADFQQQEEEDQTIIPRLSQLPPAVRNVVGAIRTYGFGIDVFQQVISDSDTTHAEAWVSTYQPVWGQNIRAERIRDFRQAHPGEPNKPDTVSRSTTAPARLTEQHTSPVQSPTPTADNEVFSMWIQQSQQQEDEANSFGAITDEGGSMRSLEAPAEELSEQEQFSQWVRGDAASAGTRNSSIVEAEVDNAGTFHRSMFETDPNSDDDSVKEDELKKQVGLSDHLSKAVALLVGGDTTDETTDPMNVVVVNPTTAALVSSSTEELRPLSNYELTNGCVPIFGEDDAPLPDALDLGSFETKDEQARTQEMKRAQEVIDKFVPPNVFGTIACPSPATGPDDSQSWNSRAPSSSRSFTVRGSSSVATGTDPGSVSLHPSPTRLAKRAISAPEHRTPPPPVSMDGSFSRSVTQGASTSSPSRRKKTSSKKPRVPRVRRGWWNITNEESAPYAGLAEDNNFDKTSTIPDGSVISKMHIRAPMPHRSLAPVVTNLEPSPEKLRDDNMSLSHLHAATSMEQTLPFLSDRPPSHRFLQIDTKDVYFESFQGEIEPLFCSLAIYNIETVSGVPGGGEPTPAPIPDLQRCGRVTESLYFDVVSDPSVAQRCGGSLWPYGESDENNRFEGTRCGVFPLPSNLSVANLYAVLIVRKVLASDASLEPYIQPGRSVVDMEKMRLGAEKASRRHGQFLMPFAFGVAPLVQVFGTEDPMFAISRAVQIPLFRFKGEERRIIDHIMVMLFPMADYKSVGIGGPAPGTNEGMATLIMRNFGYLGLHVAVDNKSSLAKARLVDFTRELQVRRSTEEDPDDPNFVLEAEKEGPFNRKLQKWRPQFHAEPTKDGGRAASQKDSVNPQTMYAQEVAPIPLEPSPAMRLASKDSDRLYGSDIEPVYHTVFCNELLCCPRVMHNCSKRTVVVKVELRELEWREGSSAYFAHLPDGFDAFHNTRRGPHLVRYSFSTCSTRSHSKEHHFLDDFKVKLPLDLKPRNRLGTPRRLVLLFTVYSVKVTSQSMWKRAMKLTAEGSTETVPLDPSGKSRLEQIACGFLPISTSSSRVLDDGLHDVRMTWRAKPPPKDLVGQGLLSESAIMLLEKKEPTEHGQPSGRDDSITNEDGSIGSKSSDREGCSDTSFVLDNKSLTTGSDIGSIAGESRVGSFGEEPICLSVRIVVHSSLHTQNDALSDFLTEEPDFPASVSQSNINNFLFTAQMNRDALIHAVDAAQSEKNFGVNDHLLQTTISTTDPQFCSGASSTPFLTRTLSVLWRQFICGDVTPDLTWANPASSVPLRVHSFASILHLFGGACLHLTKNGATSLSGKGKLSISVLGRAVALLFNESKFFGPHSLEAMDESTLEDLFRSRASKKKSPNKRGRHVRSTMDLYNLQGGDGLDSDDDLLSSIAGELASSVPRKVPKAAEKPGDPVLEMKALETTWERKPKSFVGESSGTAAGKQLKIDSQSDFQSALRAAVASVDEDFDMVQKGKGSSSSGSKAAYAMISAFGDVSPSSSRRWMTAPVPSRKLTTIKESEDGDETGTLLDDLNNLPGAIVTSIESPADSDEGRIMRQKKGVRQFRIPNIDREKLEKRDTESETKTTDSSIQSSSTITSVPKSEEELESATLPFLEVIGKNLGIDTTSSDNADETKRVGSSHHRKTRSRSSIDWSLMMDHGSVSDLRQTFAPQDVADDDRMSTLEKERNSEIILPSFLDRLQVMGATRSASARWFPYAYEVIIMQWAAILHEQRRLGKHGEAGSSAANEDAVQTQASKASSEALTQSALRSIGVAVAAAPMLFEVIKQSLGFRVHRLFQEQLENGDSQDCPPLVFLDEDLSSSLEQIIVMVTDVCLAAENFDSWDLRQTSVDVNDATVRFLRDMFCFLSPVCVHRLLLAYFLRFRNKGSKGFHDKDSAIGLRVSWELTKLRLNAVTLLARFQDFVRVNSPQMFNWGKWWTETPSISSKEFFERTLARYEELSLLPFVDSENTESLSIPPMRFHWLAELLVDICLLGTEHVEQQIQNRASSLLHELFWSCSQESLMNGTSAPVSSMFITVIEKMLSRVAFLSSFSPKSQLRKDLLPCVVFVLQGASTGLLRALWRRLCQNVVGAGQVEKYKRTTSASSIGVGDGYQSTVADDAKGADAIDMFSLLNLALRTLEFEGSEEHIEADNSDASESVSVWRKEFLLSKANSGRRSEQKAIGTEKVQDPHEDTYTSSVSRRWQAHDAAVVIVNTGHQLVLEMYKILRKCPTGKSFLNPAVKISSGASSPVAVQAVLGRDEAQEFSSGLSYADVILFVRAATSLYLHALALRESDLAIIRTLKLTAETIKIFGITIFLEAVGQTLQHWMRVILLHCGARRATLRIESADLLELILRSTWECYGSFFRIRVPLLAVQTEVMERIVATAAARYYREQRQHSMLFEPFSNVSAEASLVPLWRTFDRIETQPATKNAAYLGALIRMAEKLKTLYRAYVAARVLSFLHGSQGSFEEDSESNNAYGMEARIRANRISVLRVINQSGGHSKQFLGFQGTQHHRSRVAHFEAVEDALIDAANVFSPTELPEHRVAWLRMLADFHASRKKFAEEATCHFQIHTTLNQAAKLHGALWSNTPFLPWTDDMPDPVYNIDGDSPIEPDYQSDLDVDYDADAPNGRRMDNVSSFRRIFYRVANSVGQGNNDWYAASSKLLFCGLAFPSEYHTISPWISLQNMEEDMVEESENAAELFLRAGIVENSRLSWSLAAQYYSEKFNYTKLALTYGRLSKAIISQVPRIDSSLPHEVGDSLGRFYRVWFHGGAPDELTGVEFVYRTEGTVSLNQFGEGLTAVIKSIIPDNTPIHLLLEGHAEDRSLEGGENFSFSSRMTQAPLEPVKIKVTRLRPIFGNQGNSRGLPEWFLRYTDEAFSGGSSSSGRSSTTFGGRVGVIRNDSYHGSEGPYDGLDREHSRSLSAGIFSVNSSSTAPARGRVHRTNRGFGDRSSRWSQPRESELNGVDRFYFIQARDRRTKEWWTASDGNFIEKSLKVTQLQVAQPFPACSARQAVIHRTRMVFSISPLEAGVDTLCQWCAMLFRTAIATVGMSVLGSNTDPGIGTDAAKVVAHCVLHSTHVHDIGMALLRSPSELNKDESTNEFALEVDHLSEEETRVLQIKLARLIVVFLELLHILVARNRELLLELLNERKKGDASSRVGQSSRPDSVIGSLSLHTDRSSHYHFPGRTPSTAPTGSRGSETIARRLLSRRAGTPSDKGSRSDTADKLRSGTKRSTHTRGPSDDAHTVNSVQSGGALKTDSAIPVQSELQRAFIGLTKALYPRIHGVLQSDTPRWLKQCGQENYFSMGIYRQTKIPIAAELCLQDVAAATTTPPSSKRAVSSESGYESPRGGGSLAGSSHSVVSRGSERYGFGQF